MSISSEISRISGNVSDSLAAVAAKGVTVPSGSNSDDLAGLIAQISSGGTGAISIVDTADSGGGTVRTITAVDISDTTAAAGDVASGKYFYTADGTKTAGTASGGGGGLTYETGTYTPASDVALPTINFSKTYTEAPSFVLIGNVSATSNYQNNTNFSFGYVDFYKLFGEGVIFSSSARKYGVWGTMTSGSSATALGTYMFSYSSDNQSDSSSGYPRYFVTESGFKPGNSTSRYWRSGQTYKWIAVWKPTT